MSIGASQVCDGAPPGAIRRLMPGGDRTGASSIRAMTERNAQFTGSIPAAYHRFLGPMLFEPFADDLTARLTVPPTAALSLLGPCGLTSA